MNLHDPDFLESVSFFRQGCEAPYSNEEEMVRVGQEIGLTSDLPSVFASLAWEFVSHEPQCYWSHNVAEEMHRRLSELHAQDPAKMSSALDSAQEHFFAGINSYDIAVSVQRELSDVAYEESLKTKIFRNPLYVQLCEDCLMNVYRGLRCVVQEFRTDKDYSTLDTLGKLLPALRSNGFSAVCEVDSNIRNAINHGSTVSEGNTVFFKHKSSSGYTVREMGVWEYQDLINETMDLAGGTIVGLVRFLAERPELIQSLCAPDDENIRFQWFSLLFRAPGTRLLFTRPRRSTIGSPQLSITAETSIQDKNRLLMVLIQILRATHVAFPGYERYLVGYQHDRSPMGFVRLDRETLERTSDTAELLDAAIRSGEVSLFPIQEDEVDERAYRFHVFPTLACEDWVVRGIEDCSIEGHKRIRAQLLLDRVETREDIRNFVGDSLAQIRKLRTPKNPHESVPFGDVEADIVFLHVFLRSRKRKSFTLFPNNPHFICMAAYYATEGAPRVKHGAIPELIWKQLEHEASGETTIAWNPNVTS